ncbi:MAG: TIGR00266 family protein [Clostridia bacterium]|nr:TIGR00266 family protein [Clostridia bacterium]
MKYEIIGNTMPAVEVSFDSAGESMFTQSGGMAWMSEGVKMDTNTRGGVLKGLGRMFAGESMFMATYTAQRPGASVAFSATFPGEIMAIDLAKSGGMICQKGAFLAAEDSVKLETLLTKTISSGLFGGEGFVLQGLSGNGIAFLEVDGNKVVKSLAPGETIFVDTGNVVAFQSSVRYEIETVKGVKNIFLGGEGLFLTKLTGPGDVVLQTQNIGEFAGKIANLIPSKN